MIDLKELRSEYARYKFKSRDDMQRCYAALLEGDQSARDRMIEGALFLIPKCVGQLLRTRPKQGVQADEYVSSGLKIVVEAVDKLPEQPKRDNPLAFVYCRLRWKLNEVPWEPLLPVKNRTIISEFKNGEDSIPSMYLGVSPRHLAGDPFAESEFVDWLFAQCRSDRERQFLRLKMSGYTVDEIAEELSFHKSTVYRIQRTLNQRVMTNYERDFLAGATGAGE